MQFLALLALLPLIAAQGSLPESYCDTCDPSPPNNLCHESTSCVTIGARNYCACRAGYRATGELAPETSWAQWRLPTPGQEGRVFVQPGWPCETLCDHWELGAQGCSEVLLEDQCA